MPHTDIATEETPWACKWTRLGSRQSGIPDYKTPEPPIWVCVREPSAARVVTEPDCDGCPHWERNEAHPYVE